MSTAGGQVRRTDIGEYAAQHHARPVFTLGDIRGLPCPRGTLLRVATRPIGSWKRHPPVRVSSHHPRRMRSLEYSLLALITNALDVGRLLSLVYVHTCCPCGHIVALQQLSVHCMLHGQCTSRNRHRHAAHARINSSNLGNKHDLTHAETIVSDPLIAVYRMARIERVWQCTS